MSNVGLSLDHLQQSDEAAALSLTRLDSGINANSWMAQLEREYSISDPQGAEGHEPAAAACFQTIESAKQPTGYHAHPHVGVQLYPEDLDATYRSALSHGASACAPHGAASYGSGYGLMQPYTARSSAPFPPPPPTMPPTALEAIQLPPLSLPPAVDVTPIEAADGTGASCTKPPASPRYVNSKQIHRILARRRCKVKLQASRVLRGVADAHRNKKHASRQDHANRRQRGPSGRFLSAAELAAIDVAAGEVASGELPSGQVAPSEKAQRQKAAPTPTPVPPAVFARSRGERNGPPEAPSAAADAAASLGPSKARKEAGKEASKEAMLESISKMSQMLLLQQMALQRLEEEGEEL